MIKKLMRLYQNIQRRFFTMPCEPRYDVTVWSGSPEELHRKLAPLGWGINDFSLYEKGQLLTLRKLDDIGHQYHLRLVKVKLDNKKSINMIRCHWEWSWSEFPFEHEHGTSRPLTSQEKKSFILSLK